MAPRGDAPPRQAAMETYFHDLAAALDGLVAAGETYTANFSAETSDFVRMNRGKVRQPGNVVQRYVDVDLIRGARHASHRLSLSGDLAADSERLRAAVAGLRAALPDLDADPHLLIATDVVSTRTARGGSLPPGGGRDRRRCSAPRAGRTSSACTPAGRCAAASRIRSASATGTRRRRSTCSGASTTAPTRP